MLKVLEDREEIEAAQEMLEKSMNRKADRNGSVFLGYQGGRDEVTVYWNEELNIRWAFSEASNRYWNAFGVGKPEWGSSYSYNIVVEVNPPFEGINRRVAGALAKDSDGEYYLLHNGNIGGGREGVGKTTFLRRYRGTMVDADQGGEMNTFALVAHIGGTKMGRQIADFIYEVKRIKSKTDDEIPAAILEGEKFNEEFSGKKKYDSDRKKIEAKCDHGIVVNALARLLEEEGLEVQNTQNVDLFTVNQDGEVDRMFEVKSSAITTDYYGAIGQLLFHSSRLKEKPKLVAVFPDLVEEEVKAIFDRLGISLLTYGWDDNEPAFISSFLKDL